MCDCIILRDTYNSFLAHPYISVCETVCRGQVDGVDNLFSDALNCLDDATVARKAIICEYMNVPIHAITYGGGFGLALQMIIGWRDDPGTLGLPGMIRRWDIIGKTM